MFQEQLQANIIEQVHDKGECGNVTYSPHKEVVKDQSVTKKFRMVFDASARLIMIGKFWVYIFFFYLGFLSRTFTNHRTAGEGGGHFFNSSLPLPPVHRHLDISRVITAESSPLHIASSRTRTGNLWFPSASL